MTTPHAPFLQLLAVYKWCIKKKKNHYGAKKSRYLLIKTSISAKSYILGWHKY